MNFNFINATLGDWASTHGKQYMGLGNWYLENINPIVGSVPAYTRPSKAQRAYIPLSVQNQGSGVPTVSAMGPSPRSPWSAFPLAPPVAPSPAPGAPPVAPNRSRPSLTAAQKPNQLPVTMGSYSGIYSNPASPQYRGYKSNGFLTRELRDSNKYLAGRLPRIGAALTAGMAASSMSDGGVDTAFMGAGLAYAGGAIASNVASKIRPWAAKTLRNTAETASVQRGGLQAAKFLTSMGNRNLLFAGGAMLTGVAFGAMRANSQSLATGLNANRGSRPIR